MTQNTVFTIFWAAVCVLGLFALIATVWRLFIHDDKIWPMSLSVRMTVWWGIWASIGFYNGYGFVGYMYVAVAVLEFLYFIFGFTIVEISTQYATIGFSRDKEKHILHVYPFLCVRVTVPLREGAL
jgi:hypothetical protein